jgi:alkylhydroperoxidase family enzyme
MGRSHDELVELLRIAADPDRPAPEGMAQYLDKVRRDAYRVTDADVEALRERGFSEDEIFEQTVSAAVAAGLLRLEAALRVVS